MNTFFPRFKSNRLIVSPMFINRTNSSTICTIFRPNFNKMIVTFHTWNKFRYCTSFDFWTDIWPKGKENISHLELRFIFSVDCRLIPVRNSINRININKFIWTVFVFQSVESILILMTMINDCLSVKQKKKLTYPSLIQYHQDFHLQIHQHLAIDGIRRK